MEDSGELFRETVFIDGTKLEACANKYTFVWKKSVGKWEKNVSEDTGCHTASEQGISEGFFDHFRNKDTRPVENSLVFRKTMPDR